MRVISMSAVAVLAIALGIPAAAPPALATTATATAATAATVTAATVTAATVTAKPEHPLSGLSCVSAKYCVGVGTNLTADGGNGAPLTETWNGTRWAAATPPLPAGGTGGSLAGLSCLSAKSCVAVGYSLTTAGIFALAEFWSGKRWAADTPPAPPGSLGANLDRISCTAAKSCVAVGSYETSDGNSSAFASWWNGTRWTAAEPPVPAATIGADLDGVSCTSAKHCIAVGFYGLEMGESALPIVESWNGAKWAMAKPPAPTGTTPTLLAGLSCRSASSCVAVGTYSRANSTSLGLAESWNGKHWADFTVPVTGHYGGMNGVSCSTPKDCLAVGEHSAAPFAMQGLPAADAWNGKSWKLVPVPTPAGGGGSSGASALTGVDCLSATDCVAVGTTGPSADAALRGFSAFWNGKAWRLVTTA